MNFISSEEAIFSIIQNGCQRDDIGMTLVIGPSWSEMKALRKEFNDGAGKSKLYPTKSQDPGSTYVTTLFSEWLVESKGFRPLSFVPVYLDDLDKEPNPRDTDIVCQTFDSVIEQFKLHAKGVPLSNVLLADVPNKLRIGWVILKGSHSIHIQMPLSCFKEESHRQRNDQKLVELLVRAVNSVDGRQKLVAWLVGKANGDKAE